MSRPTKENRYISRKNTEQYCENFREIREYYNCLYSMIYKNRRKRTDEIISALSGTFNKIVDLPSLNKEIVKMKTVSADRSHHCELIINYGNALMDNDQKAKVEYDGKIRIIEVKKELSKKRAEELKNSDTYIRNDKKVVSKKDEAIEFMNRYLDGEKLEEQYDKKTFYNMILLLRKYLKEIDLEKYSEFLIKYYKLEYFSEKELKQLKEVIEYFIKGIDSKITTLKSLDPANFDDIKPIKQLPVKRFDSSSQAASLNVNTTYKRKMNILESEKSGYTKYANLINSILEDNDFDMNNKFTTEEKKYIKDDFDFLGDYLDQIKSVSDVFNSNVKKVNTIANSTKKELKYTFTKKMVKED